MFSGRKKAHKHKLSALVNVQMVLGQTAGCPRVNRAKKFMCSPRNTGNINFSLWLTGGLSQGCPDFQKVYVFEVYVPFLALVLSVAHRDSQQTLTDSFWKMLFELWLASFHAQLGEPYPVKAVIGI